MVSNTRNRKKWKKILSTRSIILSTRFPLARIDEKSKKCSPVDRNMVSTNINRGRMKQAVFRKIQKWFTKARVNEKWLKMVRTK